MRTQTTSFQDHCFLGNLTFHSPLYFLPFFSYNPLTPTPETLAQDSSRDSPAAANFLKEARSSVLKKDEVGRMAPADHEGIRLGLSWKNLSCSFLCVWNTKAPPGAGRNKQSPGLGAHGQVRHDSLSFAFIPHSFHGLTWGWRALTL